MIILLLCEPRSGSTNLANWFFYNENFTVLFIPSDPKSKWYINKPPSEYKYKTKNLLIKEDYYPHKNYQEFLKISDKVILLYRENENDQIESWCNVLLTNNWHGEYVPVAHNNPNNEQYFKSLKNSFKNNFLEKNHFKISYEELYYKNGFKKVLDYLEIPDLENKNFPYGKKYRIDVNKTKSII